MSDAQPPINGVPMSHDPAFLETSKLLVGKDAADANNICGNFGENIMRIFEIAGKVIIRIALL
jgi:hypothetical protein